MRSFIECLSFLFWVVTLVGQVTRIFAANWLKYWMTFNKNEGGAPQLNTEGLPHGRKTPYAHHTMISVQLFDNRTPCIGNVLQWD
ncbi:uncharacterized protein EI90DRAFT_2692868 [Cantharellus anzutake]|uniref:uncharacterized protein n=1 Tax=Cantharellus anzutake TaxID=1750568 RepID=UPI00190352CC|nr:uncharacterized protein EI90DRAFT_2692868 [Cantharellus anzutake]KAF8318939.1 hypothetical protein EI90DRAFT_2692868 [Cantharellus anzutake]